MGLVGRVKVAAKVAIERGGRVALQRRCFAVVRIVDALRGVEVADLERTALALVARAPQEAVHVLDARANLLDYASELLAAARACDRRPVLVDILKMIVHLFAHGLDALHRDTVLAAAARREQGVAVQDKDVTRLVAVAFEAFERSGDDLLLPTELVK